MSSRVYETAIKIAATISKSFKTDVQNASKALTGFAGASKAAQAAVLAAKGKYNTATDALRRLKDAEGAAGKATKESTKWRKAGERAIAATARELDRATKAAEKNAAANRKANVEQIKAARQRLFGSADSTPLFQKASGQFRSLARDVALIGGAAVAAGAGILALATRVAEGGDRSAKMAKRLGINVEALQELEYAGRRSGAAVEDVDKALGKLSISIGKHKLAKGKGGGGGATLPGVEMLGVGGEAGGGSAMDPFKVLGLSAKKLSQLKPDEQLAQIADAMSKLKTDSERAAVGTAIFGKGALAFLPALKKGSAGLRELREQARATGGVLGADAAEQSEKFKDAQIDAQLAMEGLANTLGVAFLPLLTKRQQDLSAWVRNNRVEIKKWIDDTAKWIQTKGLPALKELGREAKNFAMRIVDLVQGAARLIGGLGNLGIALAALRIAPLAITMAKISLTTFKAADGLFKYAAAAKAAKAAGGVGEVQLSAGGKALGVAAAAAMLAQAAAIGYAIGTALDEYFGLSNKIVGFVRNISGQGEKENTNIELAAQVNELQLKRKQLEREGRARSFQAKGFGRGQSLYFADHPDEAPSSAPSQVRTGSAAANIAPVVHIHGHPSSDQVRKGLNQSTDTVVDQYERHQSNQRRLSYGQ